MTDKAKLLALAEAVEKLTGPDREVMYAAFDACLPRTVPSEPNVVVWTREWLRFQGLVNAEAWLDSAMMLVPANSLWNVGTDIDGPYARVLPPVGNGWTNSKEHYALAATMPLALLSSALRAQAEALA